MCRLDKSIRRFIQFHFRTLKRERSRKPSYVSHISMPFSRQLPAFNVVCYLLILAKVTALFASTAINYFRFSTSLDLLIIILPVPLTQ